MQYPFKLLKISQKEFFLLSYLNLLIILIISNEFLRVYVLKDHAASFGHDYNLEILLPLNL